MAQLLLANPRKRRKSRSSSAKRKTSKRRYRRNPLPRGDLMATVKKGAVGALGAIGVDVAMQKLPIPAGLSAGNLAPAIRGGLGVLLGMVVAMIGKTSGAKAIGHQLADGAVTVALYGTAKNLIGPSLGLSGDDYSLLGYDDGLLGYDEFDNDDGMSYVSPAEIMEGEFNYVEDEYF